MLEGAPKYLLNRFYSLREYARHELFPGRQYLNQLNQHQTTEAKALFKSESKDIIDEVAFLLLVFFMRSFFAEGTKIAIETVDLLNELHCSGFSFGSREFVERNENVMMGKVLSEKLYCGLSREVRDLIGEKKHHYEIVELYRDRVNQL